MTVFRPAFIILWEMRDYTNFQPIHYFNSLTPENRKALTAFAAFVAVATVVFLIFRPGAVPAPGITYSKPKGNSPLPIRASLVILDCANAICTIAGPTTVVASLADKFKAHFEQKLEVVEVERDVPAEEYAAIQVNFPAKSGGNPPGPRISPLVFTNFLVANELSLLSCSGEAVKLTCWFSLSWMI